MKGRSAGSSNGPDRSDSRKAESFASAVKGEIQRIKQAIARQSYKSALAMAKQLHKEVANPESESILVEAYLARIEGMIDKEMLAEAESLLGLVISRFPQAADQARQLQCTLAARTLNLRKLVEPLTGIYSHRKWPEAVRNAIRGQITDPTDLAECTALPPDHPLRKAAASIATAFEAVTSGPVDEAALVLADVPRQSPLAPWKFLIRAIASLYQGRDEECLRHLEAIDGDSTPARLVPVVKAISAGCRESALDPAVSGLVQDVTGCSTSLQTALKSLDESFDRHDRNPGKRIREAIRLCKRVQPRLVKRLRQHIEIKAVTSDLYPEEIFEILGQPAVRDAYFWRLFARAAEGDGQIAHACAMWDRFRLAAIEEGLFGPRSPENAFLYAYMAGGLRRLEKDHLREIQKDFFHGLTEWDDLCDEDKPPPEEDTYYLFPEKMYERACRIRPDVEIFREWLGYTKSTDRKKTGPDKVALKWAEAFPRDWRPFHHLAESAEERGAFTKALKYIGKAEQLGGRDSQAGRARLRLLVAKAVRHLKQQRGDLAEKDFSDIRELPQSAEQDRPAYVASLEWVRAEKAGDKTGAERWAGTVCEMVGGWLPGSLLLICAARQCGLVSMAFLDLSKRLSSHKKKDLIQALIRLGPISNDMRFEIVLPDGWPDRLAKWFKRSDCSLAPGQLRILAETAYAARSMDVVYYCCRHGLGAGNPDRARFLFLRAMSLPGYSIDRKESCFAAALALARRSRNMDLVSEIIDTRRRAFGRAAWRNYDPFMMDLDDEEMDGDELEGILKDEHKEKDYPALPFPRNEPAGSCQCPDCRRRREGGERKRKKRRKSKSGSSSRAVQGALFGDLLEGDEGRPQETFEEDGPVPAFTGDLDGPRIGKPGPPDLGGSGIPTGLIEAMAEIVRLNGGEEPSDSDLRRILNEHSGMRDRIEGLLEEAMSDDAGLFEAFQGVIPDPRRRSGSRGPKKRKR